MSVIQRRQIDREIYEDVYVLSYASIINMMRLASLAETETHTHKHKQAEEKKQRKSNINNLSCLFPPNQCEWFKRENKIQ